MALTIFLKLFMMFIIDIRKKATGQDFSKKSFLQELLGKKPIVYVLCPYPKKGYNDFSETLHDLYNRSLSLFRFS